MNWLVGSGLVYVVSGPHDQAPRGAMVNMMTTRPKPNGSTRIIVNQSEPDGTSVNDGIDESRYPAYMGG